MPLPKLRCGYRTILCNRVGHKVVVKWFGISWGSFFYGIAVMEG
jgi:hypothetical protein